MTGHLRRDRYYTPPMIHHTVRRRLDKERTPNYPGPLYDEAVAAGWHYCTVDTAGFGWKIARGFLWQGPSVWTAGAVVVLHGGGGVATDFCVPGSVWLSPQIDFVTAALAAGLGVCLLESTSLVTDSLGGLIGKVWDSDPPAFTHQGRANLDLDYAREVLDTAIPAIRPPGSSTAISLAGHSSGAMFSVRIMAELGHLVSKVALVAPADPYGVHRVSTPTGPRPTVFGIMVDNGTGLEIGVSNSAVAPYTAGEQPWGTDTPKPTAKVFYDSGDGIVDVSQFAKLQTHLVAKGYTAVGSAHAESNSPDNDLWHLWQNPYNADLITFLTT